MKSNGTNFYTELYDRVIDISPDDLAHVLNVPYELAQWIQGTLAVADKGKDFESLHALYAKRTQSTNL